MSKDIKDIKINPKPMFYACVLEGLRKIALENGYALAIHGTCAFDMDLIAVRWNESVSDPEVLVERFVEELTHYHFRDEGITQLTNPERRFGNQLHYSIPIIGDWYVDLTIIES